MQTVMERTSLWTAAALGVVGFATSFGAHIVAVNLPVYAEQIGAGVAVIGLLIAAYDLAEIIAKPVFGALADRQGMQRTMQWGIVVFIAASLLYLFVHPALLLVVRFLQGMGAAALSAVSLALVGVYFAQNRGRAYGVYNAIKGAGYVVSPIVGGLIVVGSGFAMLFVAVALIGVVALALTVALPAPPSRDNPELDDDDDFSVASFLAVFRDARLLRWYAVVVVNMFFVGILFGFLPVRVHDLGYDPLASGLLLSAVALSYLLVQPLAGWLADNTDVGATIRIGLVLSGAAVVAVAFLDGALLWVACVVAGIGVGIVWTNTDTLISRLAAASKLGATMGAAGSFKEFGDMLGPILIGLLAQALGLAAGFVICGALGLLSVFLIADPHAASGNPA